MVQPRWEGFGIRLGRAIDRWPGGGQRAFTAALKEHAAKSELNIPTSYRTLLNYLSEKTQPSTAWVEAAAAVLRWNPENLLTGEGDERPGGSDRTPSGLRHTITGPTPAVHRMEVLLMDVFMPRYPYVDLPMPARWMIAEFLDMYFEPLALDWEDLPARERDVDRVMKDFFGPLIARHTMGHAATMALAAALTAAAYIRVGEQSPTQEDD